MTDRETMKQALDALENHEGNYKLGDAGCYRHEKAVTALQEALAEQPAQQEPVACQYAKDVAMPEYRCVGRCQYDTSPPAQRQPLTDEQIEREWQFLHDEEGNPPDHHDFARAIEAAHGIKEKNA